MDQLVWRPIPNLKPINEEKACCKQQSPKQEDKTGRGSNGKAAEENWYEKKKALIRDSKSLKQEEQIRSFVFIIQLVRISPMSNSNAKPPPEIYTTQPPPPSLFSLLSPRAKDLSPKHLMGLKKPKIPRPLP